MKITRLMLRVVSFIYTAGLCFLLASPYWPQGLYWLACLYQMAPLWVLYFPMAFFFVIALALKDRAMALVSVICACLILFGIMDYNIPIPDQKRLDEKARAYLKIVTCNLGTIRDTRDLSDLISRAKPDIVAMQEVSSENQSVLGFILKKDKWDTHFSGGLGLASRYKITNIETKDRNLMGGWGTMAVRYELEGPKGRVNLFIMHLDTPREGIEAVIDDGLGGLSELMRVSEMLYKESVLLSQWVSSYKNVLIAGDFNMTDTNPIFKRCWASYTDVFALAGHGFGYTKYTSWHGVRIDHVLCDASWRAIHSEAGPGVGSDHRPVIADVEWVGEK